MIAVKTNGDRRNRQRREISPNAPRVEGDLEDPGVAPGARVGDLVIEGVRLVDADLGGARLSASGLTDVAVERGNLANLVAPDLTLRRVSFTGARLTGVAWTEGTIGDVVFRDCLIDLATFAGTTFERVVFERCRLAQTDFREALFRSVRFDDCDLTEADLTGLRIDRCELHGCRLDGAAPLERLRNATMPWADVVGNAALLAGALGIRVLEEDEP
jgi:uncharacterized protein YjbI with pentapeptide repeats